MITIAKLFGSGNRLVLNPPPPKPHQPCKVFPALNETEIKAVLNRQNKDNPFNENSYIGNDEAVEFALDNAYKAFKSIASPECCPARGTAVPSVWSDHKVVSVLLLVGARSCGKTLFARGLAKLIGTPLVELDSTQLKRPEQIVEAIRRVLKENDLPLVPDKEVNNVRYYTPPPFNLYLDEVHALKGQVQDSLLKMMESNDRVLQTAAAILDFRNVLIVMSTTDPGKLRPALKSRATKITLRRHTVEEVAMMIYNKFGNYHWCPEDCMEVAQMNPIPRQAIGFADDVINACQRQNCHIGEGIKLVAKRLGFDPKTGLPSTAMESLKALANANGKCLSRKALCANLAIEEDEFMQDVLPYLMATPTHPKYIDITTRGHKLSNQGVDILRDMGIEVADE